jgi:hypothetical protein
LAQVSRDDFARRYGAFLGFLQRTRRLDHGAAAAAQVTSANVESYIADLASRVRSVTVYNCVYKLRRAAELLAPATDFSWLAEIEKDLALVMEPRSKFDRLVLTGPLLEAGLTLIAEAKEFARRPCPRRAQRVHDRLARAVPDSAEEFCCPGDRPDVYQGRPPVVDHPARRRYKVAPAGRTPGSRTPEPLDRAVRP